MSVGMAATGAAGDTAADMRSVLDFGTSTQSAPAAYKGLIELLRTLDPRVTVQVANSVWYRKGLAVEKSYLDSTRELFGAQVSELDFKDPGAPTAINEWVKTNTNGRIEDIVDKIPDTTMLYLVNAIYFKGNWRQQFDPTVTRPRPFTLPDGSQKDVPTMSTSREPMNVRFVSQNDISAVELPYGGDAFRMTIVMPGNAKDIWSLVSSIDHERFEEILAMLDNAPINEHSVSLPKFRLEQDHQLVTPLSNMGMARAFDPARADFSGICKAPRLYINEVRHKTFIDVNEEGTEAAAATSTGFEAVSAPLPVNIDRPFIFAIREKLSGAILFLGVITDPTA
jgi:serine protease inhibitor